jgi:hypothetical protein
MEGGGDMATWRHGNMWRQLQYQRSPYLQQTKKCSSIRVLQGHRNHPLEAVLVATIEAMPTMLRLLESIRPICVPGYVYAPAYRNARIGATISHQPSVMSP